ncbi:unnamed protein product (macronuclear) [Paramecium tetraurelia]|uniref:Transmembrane protein n=1 Tax=Paramecium tetraurelia TaxID=5888 RepID=A0D6M2_PARTE|nr:uncharacterized protein GSPATT00001730001 [Paramecium tetraurelia]CAK78689.1 unnamed protein product [Paramecium tetraurelia]|eukprot:XP_001446086.1 hypothetical protein (macronuclear) [Paramecium tetraurelia strain d4-2]
MQNFCNFRNYVQTEIFSSKIINGKSQHVEKQQECSIIKKSTMLNLFFSIYSSAYYSSQMLITQVFEFIVLFQVIYYSIILLRFSNLKASDILISIPMQVNNLQVSLQLRKENALKQDFKNTSTKPTIKMILFEKRKTSLIHFRIENNAKLILSKSRSIQVKN